MAAIPLLGYIDVDPVLAFIVSVISAYWFNIIGFDPTKSVAIVASSISYVNVLLAEDDP